MAGTPGSGRYTVSSKSFDLADFCEDILRHIDRHLHGDPERNLDLQTIERWHADFHALKQQLRMAIERERDR